MFQISKLTHLAPKAYFKIQVRDFLQIRINELNQIKIVFLVLKMAFSKVNIIYSKKMKKTIRRDCLVKLNKILIHIYSDKTNHKIVFLIKNL